MANEKGLQLQIALTLQTRRAVYDPDQFIKRFLKRSDLSYPFYRNRLIYFSDFFSDRIG